MGDHKLDAGSEKKKVDKKVRKLKKMKRTAERKQLELPEDFLDSGMKKVSQKSKKRNGEKSKPKKLRKQKNCSELDESIYENDQLHFEDCGFSEKLKYDLETVGHEKGEKSDLLKTKKRNIGVGNDGEGDTKPSETKKSGKGEKVKKKSKKNMDNQGEINEDDDVYQMSSGDEDCSRGMMKWLTEYHQKRPGLQILQQRIDDYMMAYDEKEERERKEREAEAAEGGWTVVVHHKGRKKTVDEESGITVGAVSQASVIDRMEKKKVKSSSNFYNFQKREAKRNELLMLQNKFEEDKKRVQELRAARKFRPY